MILTDEELGRRLRALRLEAGFSQADVAKALYCERSTYSAIERGKNRLTVEVLQKLAAFYRLPAGDLLNHELERDGKNETAQRGNRHE